MYTCAVTQFAMQEAGHIRANEHSKWGEEMLKEWKARWDGRRPEIGFIGLGIMGRPMVRNLMKAGYSVTVYNRSQGAVNELVAAGATKAVTPSELAGKSDVIITIVTDSPDVEAVVLGENGVVDGAQPGAVVIDMSTISPQVTRDIAQTLADKGVAMLDAPVSGGDKGAIAGTLSIMVGGDEAVFTACRDVFDALGKNIVHVGPNGMGQTVKLCNQVIVSINLLAVAESLTFATKAGADPTRVLDAVTKGAAGSWQLENLGPKMIEGDYAPGFMVKLLQKDLRLALEAGQAIEAAMPGTALVNQLFRSVQALGCGNEGTQALVKTLELMGQTQVRRESDAANAPEVNR